MIFYSDNDVHEAALDRIRFIFDEFADRKICVSFSGGKDSTTVLHLCKEVMDERGIEKIPVMFLDQEVEAPQTIEYVRKVMNYDWVEPYWVQCPFKEWNASAGEWFNVWGEGEQWIREKEDIAYKDIKFAHTEHFGKVMDSVHRYFFGDNYIALGGVRIDESPARRMALTLSECYPGITWGGGCAKGALVLYPIWDWRTYDVWYYIFSNRYDYCKLYNYEFTKRPLIKCRVSSFIHENSISNLEEIKEIAPEFYAKALKRVANVNTTVQSLNLFGKYVGHLPQYFSDWPDYITYIAEHLIADPENKRKILQGYNSMRKRFLPQVGKWQEGIDWLEECIGMGAASSVLCEDFELSQLNNKGIIFVKYISSHKNDIKRANPEGI